jgi:hypothetical protein
MAMGNIKVLSLVCGAPLCYLTSKEALHNFTQFVMYRNKHNIIREGVNKIMIWRTN